MKKKKKLENIQKKSLFSYKNAIISTGLSTKMFLVQKSKDI